MRRRSATVGLVRPNGKDPEQGILSREARQCATSNGWLRPPCDLAVPAAPTLRAYPTTSYGGYPGGYGYSNGYYAQPTYYQHRPTTSPQVVTQTRYVPVPVAQPAPPPHRMRDRDHDGIPDRL